MALALLDVPSAWASLVTGEGQRLCGSAWSPDAVHQTGGSGATEPSHSSVALNDRPVIIPDVGLAAHSEQQALAGSGLRACVAVPVRRSTGGAFGSHWIGDWTSPAHARTVALARGLDLSVTAEGIESEALRREVTELGCTHGQGFGLGRPAGPTAAHALAGSVAEASRRSQCG